MRRLGVTSPGRSGDRDDEPDPGEPPGGPVRVRDVDDGHVRIEITDPRTPAAAQCLRSFFQELGQRFAQGFDPARSIPASDNELTPPHGLLLVARTGEHAIDCGGLRLHESDRTADVKRMWVSAASRGRGVGRQLLARLVEEASARHIVELRLETNHVLVEARTLYETSGFVEVDAFSDEPYADHWFRRTLAHTELPPAGAVAPRPARAGAASGFEDREDDADSDRDHPASTRGI